MLPSTCHCPPKDCRSSSVYVCVFLSILLGLAVTYQRGGFCISPYRAPAPYNAHLDSRNKPILLLWLWPEGRRFDLSACQYEYGVDQCVLTDDQSLYTKAEGVLIYQRAIQSDLTNLPPADTRPAIQKWIWYNRDPPPMTTTLQNITNRFNLSMTYRRDADISLRVRVLAQKTPQAFVVPPKKHLVCWLAEGLVLGAAGDYYRELSKHVPVEVFGAPFGKPLPPPHLLYPTISSCKFHLSFEAVVHPDYITHTLLDPLASGTVPVVLGPPRKNYEAIVPRDSFLHVADFPDAKALAQRLIYLDTHAEAYANFFTWRKYLYVPPRQVEHSKQFLHDVCLACQHLGWYRIYRRILDVYKWHNNPPVPPTPK